MEHTLVGRRARRLALLLPVILSAACSISDGITQEGPSSHLRVVQAVANAPIMELVVDSTPYLSGIGFRSSSGFLEVEAGTRRVRLFPNGSATPLLDHTFPIEFPRAYTLFSTGVVGAVEAVVVPDTAAIPGPGEIKLRVIQAAPSAGTVDVYITDPSVPIDSATPILEDVVFRGNTDYFTLPVGRYRIRLTTANTRTVVLDMNQLISERAMRTVVATDAAGGGTPLVGILLVDF
ncbi:MAG: DUF4397 domain-containing protein [Gemmatimonadetes bacterium]|nr:DUF4397 domain-containing protein [Gemmatimonadota bacterium]